HQQFTADLSAQAGINSLILQLPSLEGVVLCAGKGLTLPIQFSTREKFDDIFSINFFSPVELLRQMFKKKLLVKNASVVMIASIGGIHRITFGNGVYGASKSALNSIMRFCAREFASSRKIRVNSICPGMIETPLIHRGTITEEQYDADRKQTPLQRYGHPEDVAYAVIYLLSDAASYMTGHELVIDGGVTA
ncbi:MAG: SDR family oxidoreductase, partial [Prevotellaceae bacterium]|nr:SDR family oxidoreductase [Prevotellaceae bacterium]